MGAPYEPLSPRDELIAELEGLGYDTMPGTRVDWPDWRERCSDDELSTIVRNLRHAAAGGNELPDVSDLLDVIRKAEAALAAGQKMLCGNDHTDDRSLFQLTVFFAALKSCRDILDEADRAFEASS